MIRRKRSRPCVFFASTSCPACGPTPRCPTPRHPNERELKATSVLRVPIEEFSAKVRIGPPIDDEEDYSFPTWAGVIPLEMIAGAPIDDGRLDPKRGVPTYARHYTRKR